VQEAYATRPDVRDACAESIFGHASTLALDIGQARAAREIEGDGTAEDLAQHAQAVIQGAFILAKAKNSRAPALESLNHLHRYIELLFGVASSASPSSR
jgi:TetR/AcrR family transcriptional regulator, transcriptional repressor for nem operon